MLLLFYAMPPTDFYDPIQPEPLAILDDDDEILALLAHVAFFE